MGVDKNKPHVAHAEGGVCVAHEVIRSRTVDYIEFLIVEFGIENSREYGVTILFLYGKIVGYGIACVNRSATFYNSTLVNHRFGECGFPGAL